MLSNPARPTSSVRKVRLNQQRLAPNLSTTVPLRRSKVPAQRVTTQTTRVEGPAIEQNASMGGASADDELGEKGHRYGSSPSRHEVSLIDLIKPARPKKVLGEFELIPRLRDVVALEDMAEPNAFDEQEWEHLTYSPLLATSALRSVKPSYADAVKV